MLFCGGDHAPAAARIGNGIAIRGVTVITGEVGLGPTTRVIGRPCLTTGAHEVGRSTRMARHAGRPTGPKPIGSEH